jgi:predicted ester cyclase
MTPEERELPHRSHRDWLSQGRPEVVDEIYIEDCEIISPNVPPNLRRGRDAFKAYGNFLRSAFPDINITDNDVVCEGELAAVSWTFTATHLGEFFGVPPSGRKVEITGFDIMVIRDGWIHALYLEQDLMGLLTQIGAFESRR